MAVPTSCHHPCHVHCLLEWRAEYREGRTCRCPARGCARTFEAFQVYQRTSDELTLVTVIDFTTTAGQRQRQRGSNMRRSRSLDSYDERYVHPQMHSSPRRHISLQNSFSSLPAISESTLIRSEANLIQRPASPLSPRFQDSLQSHRSSPRRRMSPCSALPVIPEITQETSGIQQEQMDTESSMETNPISEKSEEFGTF
ncbi:unnamed protein product [Hymenolepis diminuta]|nr:unnamed protein product [Hymenolepis diminuta]